MCVVLHPTLHTPGDTVPVHHCMCAAQGWMVGSAHEVVLGRVVKCKVPDAACCSISHINMVPDSLEKCQISDYHQHEGTWDTCD